MTTPAQPWFRRLLPWTVGGLWVLLTIVALQQVLGIRRSLRDRATDTVGQRLNAAITAWEDRLTGDLGAVLDDATVERAAELQRRGRARGTFSALYLWVPDRDIRGRDAPRLVFPTETPLERDESTARVTCGAAARNLARAGAPAFEVARAWRTGCAGASESVRLYAADQAATYLELDGRVAEAAAALDDAIGTAPAPLVPTRGAPPQALARVRLHQISLLTRSGRAQDAADARTRLARDLADLDAPDAAALTSVARGLVSSARDAGGPEEAARIESLLGPADRRIAAWREVRQRVLADPPAPSSTPIPRFSRDQYSDMPFVIFLRWNADGSGGAAQLEVLELIDSLLSRPELATLRAHLVVSQDQGDVLAGSRGSDPVVFEAGLWRTLQWLRVGVRKEAVEAETRASGGLWVGPAALIGVTAIIGLGLLWVLARASAQERAMLARQREFSTRVTHELKTPLAGIRLMAENLSMGTGRSDAERADMAQGIIREADRLTRRVDEILSVARERVVPDPEPIDMEDILLVAVEEWGPRLEASGVRLVAEEVDSVRPVLGDAVAVRDAVACLLDNALKYRRDDIPDPTVWLTLHEERDDIVVEVADNGIGVPEGQRQAIFEPYVRVEGEGRGRAGGYGLGLAQVADIARVHGGTADCQGRPGGGSRFALRLPAAPEG
jgi:signal transduction histidine kinase